MQGLPIFEENGPDDFKGIDIMRTVRSFDPCLPCGVHMYLGKGKTLEQRALADVRRAAAADVPCSWMTASRRGASPRRGAARARSRQRPGRARTAPCAALARPLRRGLARSWAAERRRRPLRRRSPTTSWSRTCCCCTACTRSPSRRACAGRSTRCGPYLGSHGGDVELRRRRGRRRAAAAAGQLRRLPVVGRDAEARDRGGDATGGARHRAHRGRGRAGAAAAPRAAPDRARSPRGAARQRVTRRCGPLRLPRARATRRQRAAATRRRAAEERCELCGEPIPAEHRHLLDARAPRAECACRACTLCSTAPAPAAAHYRLVPDRRPRLADLELDDAAWAAPAASRSTWRSSSAARADAARRSAFYPGPMGATESLLELDGVGRARAANPVLGELEPDVEALLVRPRRAARGDAWLVPIDDCYALVGADPHALARVRRRRRGAGRRSDASSTAAPARAAGTPARRSDADMRSASPT